MLVHAAGDAAVNTEDYYFLSNLDQNVDVLMKTVHVFNSSSEAHSHNAATLIRESLSTVLSYYYPFEGALAVRPDGRLAVRNVRRGVPFVEAAADYELREVTDVSAPCAAEVLADLVYVDMDSENALEAPLLTVQVTTFRRASGRSNSARASRSIPRRAYADTMAVQVTTSRSGVPSNSLRASHTRPSAASSAMRRLVSSTRSSPTEAAEALALP